LKQILTKKTEIIENQHLKITEMQTKMSNSLKEIEILRNINKKLKEENTKIIFAPRLMHKKR